MHTRHGIARHPYSLHVPCRKKLPMFIPCVYLAQRKISPGTLYIRTLLLLLVRQDGTPGQPCHNTWYIFYATVSTQQARNSTPKPFVCLIPHQLLLPQNANSTMTTHTHSHCKEVVTPKQTGKPHLFSSNTRPVEQ